VAGLDPLLFSHRPSGMAATCDPAVSVRMALYRHRGRGQVHQAQSENNHRIFYGLTVWSPNSIFSVTRWRRGQTPSCEDLRFLPAPWARLYSRSLQVTNPTIASSTAIATIKHSPGTVLGLSPIYATLCDAIISPRDLKRPTTVVP